MMRPSDAPSHESMRWVPGGEFLRGSDRGYPEEAPIRKVSVRGFWMDACTVTNRKFQSFVAATGYVTLAERPANPADYPGAKPVDTSACHLGFLRCVVR